MTNEEKEKIKKGLYLLTRARINQYLVNTKQEGRFEYDNELKELFDSYYKNKYGIKNYDEFKKQFINNYLFFVRKDIKSYSPLIKNLLDTMTKDKEFNSNFELLYKISCELECASRYNFQAGQIIYDTLAQKTLKVVYDFLVEYLKWEEKKLKEEKIKIGCEDATNIFSEFSSNQKIIVSENIKYIADSIIKK